MIEEPADKRVTVRPLAVAIFGLSISIDQAPGELDFGGTNVMVFWVNVTVVAVGVAIMVTAPTAAAGVNKAVITRAATTFFIMA
jgi:hypothetical protein